jgi:hypothetical protein
VAQYSVQLDVDGTTTYPAATPETSSCSEAYLGDDGVTGKGVGGQAPLPHFGKLDYSSATVNASPLGSFDTNVQNYHEGSANVIDTGDLSHGGTAFKTTQKS